MKTKLLKILAPILILCIVFAGVHVAMGNNAPVDTSFTFSVTDGGAVLTGAEDDLSGAVLLPEEVGGYTVVGIGENAFKDCADVTAFFLPDTIVSIGSYAFENCTSLAQAILPEGLTTIGEGAFWKCESLVSITLPISVTSVGSCAFYKCTALESVVVPGVSTPIAGAFNVALDIGQTIAMRNPARETLDPVTTTVYCNADSLAYDHALYDQYIDYALLDNALTEYTVRYVDENDADLAESVTVAFQPIGIRVAAVAAVIDNDDLDYPEEAVRTITLGEADNVITFVYAAPETTTESTTEEPVTEEPYTAPTLEARAGSGACLDAESGILYGIDPLTTSAEVVDKYLQVNGDGSVQVTTTDMGFGTGSTVSLIDNADGSVLETWTVIIYGDLNGDGAIAPPDLFMLKMLLTGTLDLAEYPNAKIAGDMNLDGFLTPPDLLNLKFLVNGSRTFDQSTRSFID